MTIIAGVVGCGNISRFHFDGLDKAGVTIKWVCDLSEAAARPWAEKFGATFTNDYQDLMNDPQVTLLDINTISSVHKPICLAAIEAGKAVICEKTLGENADEALEIVRAAEAKGTLFYTSYMKRFIPAVAKAKELMPELGRILSTNIRAFQNWGELWNTHPESGFFHTPEGGMSPVRKNYGGGILVCGGSHILDLVCFLLGRPTRVYATQHIPDGRDYDLQAAALMETNNGICHYEATAHSLKTIGFLRDGWDERVEITGTAGRLEIYSSNWDCVDHKASLLIHTDGVTGNATEYRYAPVSPFAEAIQSFCTNIEAGKQGEQARTTGYDVDKLIEVIQQSAAEKQAVTVDYRI